MNETTHTVTPARSASNGSAARERDIVIRGARENNLKDIDLRLPRNKLTVITGPSGSGKSSLAFDTIYAEGQRRYVESMNAYARQFLERMDKPDVDRISGLSPAMAIEQKTTSSNPRSTVGTATELYDHLRLLFARVGRTISPQSGKEVTHDPPHFVAEQLHKRLDDSTRFYLCFPLPEHEGRTITTELEVLHQRGFFRILLLPTERQKEKGDQARVINLNDTNPEDIHYARDRMLVLVDRLAIRRDDQINISRISESVETAYKEDDDRCVIHTRSGETFRYSAYFERDGMRFEKPTPRLFSFNSPVGACPECQGAGSVRQLDDELIVPNKELSIREECVAPFRTNKWSKHHRSLVQIAEAEGIPLDTPYRDLSPKHQQIIWKGKGDYIGIEGFFNYLDRRSYKMHYRIFRARFQSYIPCPECDGYRLQPEALYVKIDGKHIGEICELPVREALAFFEGLTLAREARQVAGRVLEEIRKRLHYLEEVGLDYLTLDRMAKTLSGGESQRINLATSLGSPLVGSLYVLDEPSVGLHPRDTNRLMSVLQHLREIGNTVVVVEHEAATIREADYIVDLGPGAGSFGGEVVYEGSYEGLLADGESLTGAYLSGRKQIDLPEERRSFDDGRTIGITNARAHNLKGIDVTIPLHTLTCVTGVSGSGKSTLIHDTLFGALQRLKGNKHEEIVGAHDEIPNHDRIDQVEMVDQNAIGRSTRSNPATYINVWGTIRKLLADTYLARLRGYEPGYFSFNVSGGRCEACEGEGVVTVEMQFLADLRLECEACGGKRYKKEVLEVKYRDKNIHDILNLTVDEAAGFFEGEPSIVRSLGVLQDVGLGYITLGQPTTTLSGGEAQRLKLASYLARPASEHTLYIFDEPTTGLHFDDIRKLLAAFNALIDHGHSVIVIEHNLDVIKCADWIIDLGPDGGPAGGNVVAAGPPEQIAEADQSVTGRFLQTILHD
jgi:excinuclease ABC subunit A